MNWQPISTAPKTGPVVNVQLLLKDGRETIGHWAHGDGDGLMPPFGPAWFEQWGPVGSYREVHPEPTHWRPLS
jgi:hypothetical protein